MDLMQSFDAILFPADGRPPHVVSLMTSPASFSNPHAPAQTSTARVPHPEVHMEYIAEEPNIRAWHYQFVEALDMMNKKFANPYMIYYPVISRDRMPFPVNRTVRDIQEEVSKGRRLRDDQLWRGNLVAAKFSDDRFTQMMDASMADFPILKNFLGTHPFPGSGPTTPATASSPTTTTTTAAAHPTHPSPHPLHTPPLPGPSPNHPGSLQGGMGRQMQFAEPAGTAIPHAAAYDRDPSGHAHAHSSHGVPMAMMPTPRRDPKTLNAEHHPHQHQQHQHQHQHQHQPQHQHQHHHQHQNQQQHQHQHQHQQHPQMEL